MDVFDFVKALLDSGKAARADFLFDSVTGGDVRGGEEGHLPRFDEDCVLVVEHSFAALSQLSHNNKISTNNKNARKEEKKKKKRRETNLGAVDKSTVCGMVDDVIGLVGAVVLDRAVVLAYKALLDADITVLATADSDRFFLRPRKTCRKQNRENKKVRTSIFLSFLFAFCEERKEKHTTRGKLSALSSLTSLPQGTVTNFFFLLCQSFFSFFFFFSGHIQKSLTGCPSGSGSLPFLLCDVCVCCCCCSGGEGMKNEAGQRRERDEKEDKRMKSNKEENEVCFGALFFLFLMQRFQERIGVSQKRFRFPPFSFPFSV